MNTTHKQNNHTLNKKITEQFTYNIQTNQQN